MGISFRPRMLLWLVVIILFFVMLWARKQQDIAHKNVLVLSEQTAALTDSLHYFLAHHPAIPESWPIAEIGSIAGPWVLGLGDSLLEIHRITWGTGASLYFFVLQIRKDRSIWLEYRHARIGNSNGDIRRARLKVITSKTLPVSREKFNRFRQKLAGVSFLNATKSTPYTCCFAVESLQWDACLPNLGYLKHASECWQSDQFTQTCAIIMRLVDDPLLQGRLDFALKRR
ncbi:MAG: hypothetical protein ABIO24_14090 [Saprospiraceae bacterium]